MSLPEWESDLPHRFQSPLVLYTQTHRPACHPYSLLFINVNIYVGICFS
nr:MAG TPA: hypothetical protein [Microviridae sp.]